MSQNFNDQFIDFNFSDDSIIFTEKIEFLASVILNEKVKKNGLCLCVKLCIIPVGKRANVEPCSAYYRIIQILVI
jgi:hypothetical protein